MDELQRFDTMYSEGTMITTDRFGEKKSQFKSWSRGSSEFLIEFTNVEELGQKILRIKDELYLYYPDAEEIIPMHGSALKQSMFGDISYEDITEGKNTLDKYDVKLAGSDTVDNVECWVIDMHARSRNVPYPRKVLKVGKTDYVMREAEYYARSGRILKSLKVERIKTFDNGKSVITAMVLEDKLRHGSNTRLILEKLEISPVLDADLFTLRSLY